MYERLKYLISITNKRVLSQVVMSKQNQPLGTWILNETKHFPKNTSIKERIHYILTGEDPNCKYNQTRKFDLTKNKYNFCNSVDKCKCFKEYHTINHVNFTPEEIKLNCEKRKKTWIEKYGVDNPSKNKQVANKRKKTMSERNYTDVHKKLKENLQDLGYQNVIRRVGEFVTPAFQREEYRGCFRKNFYNWICNICGSNIVDHVDYGRIPRCLNCYPIVISKNEIIIREFVKSLGFEVIANSRDILDGQELDIFIPSKNIAIEFNGVYWHSSKWKDKHYRVDKFIKCREQGIKLIQIFEDEWTTKESIVRSRLLSVLGLSPKIYARKCSVKPIDLIQYKAFCDEYHLQGYISASIKYGLFYENKLVAIMSFRKSKDEYELMRYCSKDTVVGGASKLFSYFMRMHQPTSIIGYVDRSWSNGNLFEKLGFKNITEDDRNVRIYQVDHHKIYNCGRYNFKWLDLI